MNFLRLNRVWKERIDGGVKEFRERIYINPLQVLKIQPSKNGSYVLVSEHDAFIEVSENPEQIIEKLYELS